ncbi:hypothetical protein K0U27_06575 [archaeon]|nr:hypothetical protein [archaeon]
MKFSEEQIKEIVNLKESLIEQIDKHQEGIKMIEKNIIVLDLFLKNSSFTKASQLEINAEEKSVLTSKSEEKSVLTSKSEEKSVLTSKSEEKSVPIKRSNDGKLIAKAYITPEQVSIILDNEVLIDADTPPFKSFFLDRIIGEMKKRDNAEVENGKIQRESMIDYIINKNGPNIREIIIKNYRQKERVTEIINTAGWSLTRMLENINK